MSAAAPRPHLAALAFGALGVALLCFMDAVIKHLVATNDTLIVVFGRYLFAALFAVLLWMRVGRPTVTREAWRAHALRGVVISISAVSFFWSLSVLPLVEVIVISFLAPLLMPFTARLMLGEQVRPRNVIAGLLGFSGVIVASLGAPAEAASDGRMLGTLAVLIAAVAYAVSMTMLRGRAGKDGPEIVGLLAALIPGALVAAPALVTGSAPPASDLPAFALLGLLAAGGMYCLARAYAGAETQVLAPLEYTALLWAAAIGWFLFAEPVRAPVWAGAVIIIAACLWGAREEKPLEAAEAAAWPSAHVPIELAADVGRHILRQRPLQRRPVAFQRRADHIFDPSLGEGFVLADQRAVKVGKRAAIGRRRIGDPAFRNFMNLETVNRPCVIENDNPRIDRREHGEVRQVEPADEAYQRNDDQPAGVARRRRLRAEPHQAAEAEDDEADDEPVFENDDADDRADQRAQDLNLRQLDFFNRIDISLSRRMVGDKGAQRRR